MDASRYFCFYFIFLRTSSARGGGALPEFFLSFYFFPCLADHERDWPPCKEVFFGLATNALNVRNNNNNIASVLFLLFVWCPCMAIDVVSGTTGELLPDIVLLTQCYYHRGTRLNATKIFLSLQPMIPPKLADFFFLLFFPCSADLMLTQGYCHWGTRFNSK